MTRADSMKIAKMAWAQRADLELDDFVVEGFHQCLADTDFEEGMAATISCLKDFGRTFPPTTGEILERAHKLHVEKLRKEQFEKAKQEEAKRLQLEPRIFTVEEIEAVIAETWAKRPEAAKKLREAGIA